MSRIDRTFGIARSVAMYYGIPLRARRLRNFYSQFVPRGSLCFDVGAHVGNRVRCWRKLGARVVAVEPQPDFARLLRLLYGRDRGVELVTAALGRSAGTATSVEVPSTRSAASGDAEIRMRSPARNAGWRCAESLRTTSTADAGWPRSRRRGCTVRERSGAEGWTSVVGAGPTRRAWGEHTA